MQSSSRNRPGPSLPMVDLGKAIASQIIVFHHLALYGPMADVADALLGDMRDWLVEHGRLAVQVFLVMGGFLAARSLLPHPGASVQSFPVAWPQVLLRRLQRLVPAYWVALLAAVACAWLARALVDHSESPAAPTVGQFIANALLLQDVLGEEALSAGFWYVAMDLQLFALLASLCALRAFWAGDGVWRARATVLTVLLLTVGSLLVFNRDSTLDIWALYFMGAYGLGILAQWAQATPHRLGWTTLIVLLTGVALLVEWRSRIALAGAVAVVLALDVGRAWRWLGGGPLQRLLAFLSRISYTVFLLHYPVMLAVGAVVYRLWPASPEMHLVGLLVAWGVALLVGWGLERLLAPPRPAVQEPSVPRASISKGLSR